jgi:acetyltransferase
MRFHYMTKRFREIASRFCCSDGHRETVVVAETQSEGRSILIGFGVLAMDRLHRTAELAVLVGDPWQGKGLGSVLSDHLIESARLLGLKSVKAVTTPDNLQVIQMAGRRRFLVAYDSRQKLVALRRALRPRQRTRKTA